MSSELSEIVLAFILYIFVQFLTYVNSSKIYSALFFALFLDFSLVQNYEIFLNTSLEELLLYMPYFVLLTLYTFAVFEINGWKNLLDYIYETITGHTYHPMNIRSFFFIWPFFAEFLCKNKNINGNKLLLALIILTLSIFKELLKKYYILILIVIYNYNSPFIFWLWFNHLFLILILISLLPIDPKVVWFINDFFGTCCLSWLGSYQTLKLGKIKLNFWTPSDLVDPDLVYTNKINKLISDLDNLEKDITLIDTLLRRFCLYIKKKYTKNDTLI